MNLVVVEPGGLALRLAMLHLELDVGDRVEAVITSPDLVAMSFHALAAGAGFDVVKTDQTDTTVIDVTLERLWTLPDTVGPKMALLICGLNPSPAAADTGVGFAGPGNRFWPAAIQAGILSIDRNPLSALTDSGIGMTDLVKRTTRAARELRAAEYRGGLERIEALVDQLRPGAICFVGLAGWRAAVDSKATVGEQDGLLGGRPVYVMGSTSGLNARVLIDEHAGHLRAAYEVGVEHR